MDADSKSFTQNLKADLGSSCKGNTFWVGVRRVVDRYSGTLAVAWCGWLATLLFLSKITVSSFFFFSLVLLIAQITWLDGF